MTSAPDPNGPLTIPIKNLREQVLPHSGAPLAERVEALSELWRKHHAAAVHNGMSLQDAARTADQLDACVRTALKTMSRPALGSKLKH